MINRFKIASTVLRVMKCFSLQEEFLIESPNLLSRKKFSKIVVVPDVAAERVVATPILAAALDRFSPRPWVDPQLNPYHPNQRISVPEKRFHT